MKKIYNFIGGEFTAPLNEIYSVNFNPATGEIESKTPDSQREDVARAVAAAKQALPSWRHKLPRERAYYLNKIADLVDDRKEALAQAESMDQGKTYTQALKIEIPRVAQNFRYFAGLIEHTAEKCFQQTENSFHYTVRQPVGVCGLISPWNLPLYLLSWKIAPALAMGNTAVCKPSELTPTTAHLLCQIFQDVGLPPGVCNVVFGTGKDAGHALVSHPDVPLVSFTGGTQTGSLISQSAAPFQKKLSLELGGKNPALIFSDAPYENALKTTLRSSFTNQGEICLCTSRIYVEESLFPRFLSDFVKGAREIRVGDPLSLDTDMGAIVSRQHLDKIQSYVDLAKSEANIICGGTPPETLPEHCRDGFYLKPTVITGASPSSRLIQEEIFGPVVCISSFSSEEEATELANSTSYGLAATVFTENLSRAHRVSQNIEAGMVWVNRWLQRDLRTPFGGVKHSGVGREGGEHSVEFYTEEKSININF